MWYENVGRTFFRFVTICAFVRQTDRQLFPAALHVVAR